MKKTIRLTESDLIRIVKRVINEDTSSNMTVQSQLEKAFPDIDIIDLKDKWKRFTKAYKSCVGDKGREVKMSDAAAVMIPSCLLTIFGIVYSFGIVSVGSGVGCVAGTLLAGESIKDVAKCVKSKL
jgi:hypothetical protein